MGSVRMFRTTAERASHSMAGPVVLRKYESGPAGSLPDVLCERYATVIGFDAKSLVVEWEGDDTDGARHRFSRSSGQCIESSRGVMRDYVVPDLELKRLDVALKDVSSVIAATSLAPA